MKIRNIKQFAFPCLYPLFTLMALTRRAVAVPATVVTDVELITAIALIDMSAHSRGTASTDGMKGTPVPARKCLGGDIILLHLQHISHLKVTAHY
tara:strand:- start:588 stop:872 length:285 start_codon:yes stop_codon:yes gene_type:complete